MKPLKPVVLNEQAMEYKLSPRNSQVVRCEKNGERVWVIQARMPWKNARSLAKRLNDHDLGFVYLAERMPDNPVVKGL